MVIGQIRGGFAGDVVKIPAICVLSIVLLSGCEASGPMFTSADPVPQGRGILYIYRMPSFVNSGGIAEFYIDDKHIMSLESNGYSFCYLTTGPHELTQDWNTESIDKAIGLPVARTLLDFTVADGDTVYIRHESYLGSVEARPGKIWKMEKIHSSEPPSDIKERHFEAADAKLCG